MPAHRHSPILLKYARDMRKDPSKAEHLLWNSLRNRQILGLKFRRQEVIGLYVVDFYCQELKLVIEVDGDSHADKEDYDQQRTLWLSQQGLHVIRFENREIFEYLNQVIVEVTRVSQEIKRGCEASIDM